MVFTKNSNALFSIAIFIINIFQIYKQQTASRTHLPFIAIINCNIASMKLLAYACGIPRVYFYKNNN